MTGAAASGGGQAEQTGMGARLKQLAGQSFVYGLGGIVSKLVGIFLLPIYTKPQYVSQAGFGQVETVMAASALASIVCQFGLTTAMFRFCWDHREPDARRRTIRTSFTAVMALSTIAVVIGLIAIDPIASGLQVTRELALIGLAGLWVTINYTIVTGIYRIEQRPAAFVVYSFVNIAITIVLSVTLVIPLHMGAAGIMLGNFSGTYITYFLLLWARRDMVGLHINWPLLRQMLHFSLPLMPSGVALWALNLADRVQVQRLTPGTQLERSAQLGTYSAASKIALGIMLIVSAFQTAWIPFANLIIDDGDAKRTYRAVLTYWSMVMAWGVVAITALSTPYIHLAMNPQWFGAVPGGAAAHVGLGAVRRVLHPEHRGQPLEAHEAHARRHRHRRRGQHRPQLLDDPKVGHPRRGLVDGDRVLGARGAGLAQRAAQLPGLLRLQPRAADGGDGRHLHGGPGRGRARRSAWSGSPPVWPWWRRFPLALMAIGVVTPGERKRIAALLRQIRSPRRGRRAALEQELEIERESEEAPL